MQTFKRLLKTTVSGDVELMIADISNFYLGSVLERLEYMWLTDAQVPGDIKARYLDNII